MLVVRISVCVKEYERKRREIMFDIVFNRFVSMFLVENTES